MNQLIVECDNLLANQGFGYAFCGGHALDIHLGESIRPHGDIDISAYWEERNYIIEYMKSRDWVIYEPLGNGLVHLITDVADQKVVKRNIFCVKDSCPFFHVSLVEDGFYRCEIDHVEQHKLDYIEFLFNRCVDNEFIYSRNEKIRLDMGKAILTKAGISYLSPELVLLYKSTDLSREVNRHDFKVMLQHLSFESRIWLLNALSVAFPNGHEWIHILREIR